MSGSASEAAAKQRSAAPPNPRGGLRRNFLAPRRGRRWPHARLPALSPCAPSGRLEAAPPPAGLGARASCSPGKAGPARLQAVGEAGGRAPRGPEQTGPRPGLVSASRHRPSLACLSFSFGGCGGGHKSPSSADRPGPSQPALSRGAPGASSPLSSLSPRPPSPRGPHLLPSVQGPSLGQEDPLRAC